MPPGFIASDAGTGLFPALVSASDTVGIVNSKPLSSPVKSYPLNLKKSRKVVPLLLTHLGDVLSLSRSRILGKESNYGPKRYSYTIRKTEHQSK